MSKWWIFRKNVEMQMDRTMSNGIVNELSNHSVDDTVERLKAMLQASGAVLFGLVDHSGEAKKVQADKIADFWQPQGRNAFNVSLAQHCH